MLLVEQNANMALHAADFGYVLEVGRIVMEDTCDALLNKEDIQEFYLGVKDEGARGKRRWKKKKLWQKIIRAALVQLLKTQQLEQELALVQERCLVRSAAA